VGKGGKKGELMSTDGPTTKQADALQQVGKARIYQDK